MDGNNADSYRDASMCTHVSRWLDLYSRDNKCCTLGNGGVRRGVLDAAWMCFTKKLVNGAEECVTTILPG